MKVFAEPNFGNVCRHVPYDVQLIRIGEFLFYILANCLCHRFLSRPVQDNTWPHSKCIFGTACAIPTQILTFICSLESRGKPLKGGGFTQSNIIPQYILKNIHTVPAVSCFHYRDVIMGAIASQITSLTNIYSTVYWDADQRKHQSSASLVFVWGIHRGQVNSPHKWPVTREMFPFDDVIMFRRGLCV